MKRILVVVLLALAIAAGFFLVTSGPSEETPDDSIYLDQLQIETRDPQPAGRNLQ